jgi:hypothetical protein
MHFFPFFIPLFAEGLNHMRNWKVVALHNKFYFLLIQANNDSLWHWQHQGPVRTKGNVVFHFSGWSFLFIFHFSGWFPPHQEQPTMPAWTAPEARGGQLDEDTFSLRHLEKLWLIHMHLRKVQNDAHEIVVRIKCVKVCVLQFCMAGASGRCLLYSIVLANCDL